MAIVPHEQIGPVLIRGLYSEDGALLSFTEVMDGAKKDYLEWALRQCKGNLLQTAKLLRVSRRQVYRGIARCKIDVNAIRVETHV